jgi:hypothetical protein
MGTPVSKTEKVSTAGDTTASPRDKSEIGILNDGNIPNDKNVSVDFVSCKIYMIIIADKVSLDALW